MPRNQIGSAIMKPFVILALPGMYLFYKYNQYKQQQQEQSRRKVTERELAQLNHKIDKLLTKLEENEPELATSQEDECVICCNAKATMQTSPCGHRVVCRKCFVKTIQMAVSQRLLPLRCVICRAKILRLKQSPGHSLAYSKSWLMPSSASSYSVSAKSWSAGTSSKNYWNDKNWVPSSASQYSMSSRNVHSSASMYSMTSGTSSLSGMSSVSSATNSSVGSSSSTASGRSQPPVRQPNGSLKKSQQYSMKMRIQEYNETGVVEEGDKPSRLSPIVEFQRECRMGKERTASSSTRIRCAQKIVTQLESGPRPSDKKYIKASHSTTSSSSSTSTSFFKSSLKPSSKEEKKRDKSEEKRKGIARTESKTPMTDSTEAKDKKEKEKPRDKKETAKVDKKKSKKVEGGKGDEGGSKIDNKETEMKTSKDTNEKKEKKGKSEKETHL